MEYVRFALERISDKFPFLDNRYGGNYGCKISSSRRKARRACDCFQRFAAWLSEKYRRIVQPQELLFRADVAGRYKIKARVAGCGIRNDTAGCHGGVRGDTAPADHLQFGESCKISCTVSTNNKCRVKTFCA